MQSRPNVTLQVPLWRAIAVPVLLVVLLAGAGFLLHRLEVDAEAFMRWVDSLGPWGPVLIVVLMILHAFIPFPAELVALAAGACFGTLMGALWVWTGGVAGAVLSFLLARRWGLPLVERFLTAPQRDRLALWSLEGGPRALLICRLIPLIAFTLVNYGAGLTHVTLWTFVWTTALGILPLTLAMTFAGERMIELDLTTLLAITAVSLVLLGSGRLIWRRFTAARA